jgi:hypothetical protein
VETAFLTLPHGANFQQGDLRVAHSNHIQTIGPVIVRLLIMGQGWMLYFIKCFSTFTEMASFSYFISLIWDYLCIKVPFVVAMDL